MLRLWPKEEDNNVLSSDSPSCLRTASVDIRHVLIRDINPDSQDVLFCEEEAPDGHNVGCCLIVSLSNSIFVLRLNFESSMMTFRAENMIRIKI